MIAHRLGTSILAWRCRHGSRLRLVGERVMARISRRADSAACPKCGRSVRLA